MMGAQSCRGQVFDPETIREMSLALESVCDTLGLRTIVRLREATQAPEIAVRRREAGGWHLPRVISSRSSTHVACSSKIQCSPPRAHWQACVRICSLREPFDRCIPNDLIPIDC